MLSILNTWGDRNFDNRARFENKLYERVNTHNYYAFNAFGTYTKSLKKHNLQVCWYNWKDKLIKILKLLDGT